MAKHIGKCPHCWKELSVITSQPDKVVTCPECSHRFPVRELRTNTGVLVESRLPQVVNNPHFVPEVTDDRDRLDELIEGNVTSPVSVPSRTAVAAQVERPRQHVVAFVGGAGSLLIVALLYPGLVVVVGARIALALCTVVGLPSLGFVFWGTLLYLRIRQYHSRLVAEYERIKPLRRRQEALRQQVARRHEDVLACEAEIKVQHDQHYSDADWIDYLQRWGGGAGQVVLDYYGEEAALLRASQEHRAKTTSQFDDIDQAAHRRTMELDETKHEARKTATKHLAEVDIVIEEQRRKRNQKPGTKWGDDWGQD